MITAKKERERERASKREPEREREKLATTGFMLGAKLRIKRPIKPREERDNVEQSTGHAPVRYSVIQLLNPPIWLRLCRM